MGNQGDRKLTRATGDERRLRLYGQGAAETKSSREMRTWAKGGPHPPDPMIGPAGPGSRLPKSQSPRPRRAAGLALTSARSSGGGLPARPPARCAGMQVPEPSEAPGRGSGDPPETAQRLLQNQKGRGTGAEPRRAVQLVGSAPGPRSRGCGGAGPLEVGGRDPLRDNPRLPRAQPRLSSRAGERALRVWGGVSGLSRV